MTGRGIWKTYDMGAPLLALLVAKRIRKHKELFGSVPGVSDILSKA